MRRYILVGPCRAGKSTFARTLREQGIRTFCGDPKSKVKDVEQDVTYLPEELGIGPDSATVWIKDNWFTMHGDWCCEGWIMARALRKLLQDGTERARIVLQGVTVVVFDKQYAHAVTKPGQLSQAKAVAKVWAEIAPVLPAKVRFA